MTILEPIGKAGSNARRRGFVPCDAEDAVASHLLRPQFDGDRESLLLAAFDAYQRLVRFDRVDSETPRRCVVPPRCWRTLLVGSATSIVMAHNHPSGVAWPSDADIAATRDAAQFLRMAGIDLVDHLIFVADGHFSFRTAEML
ncbi:JAB domain-containing protein [Sphingopyxis sp. FD7]|jgi:DNA repair protein RadC|uniref:JAB domain-containing protein n=1 Tax=Sphingopyxis sp. FD7 TaxID=1914525 RepID=UPI000E7674F6|nr:JAB domain-containing protein [Sphingopyxis sp. FD7]